MSATERARRSSTSRDLEVAYRVRGTWRQVLRGISFTIGPGESFGLVGESGCGKSTAAMAAMRYLPRQRPHLGRLDHRRRQGPCRLSDSGLRRAAVAHRLDGLPGSDAALNPSLRVGRQLSEVFEIGGASKSEAADRSEAALRGVQIADPGSVLQRYPHQLSGGMAQRVVIAMALAAIPTLLVLDEPTTALDATVEAEVLDLVAALRVETDTAVLFISHNLGVIAKMCDRVGVLYAGAWSRRARPARCSTTRATRTPSACCGASRAAVSARITGGSTPSPASCRHPVRTCRAASSSTGVRSPRDRCRTDPPPAYDLGDGRRSRCHYHEEAPDLPRRTPSDVAMPAVSHEGVPILRAIDVAKTFKQSGQDVHALSGVTAELWPGETLGLVGESGSGKTTFARVVLGITAPDPGGSLELDGTVLAAHVGKRSDDDVRAMQIVFQNPDSALNRSPHRAAPGGPGPLAIGRPVWCKA